MNVLLHQLLTLVSKNILVQRRKWPWLLFEICIPLSLILILNFVETMGEDRFMNQTIYQEIPIFGNILDFEANLIDDNLLIDGINFQPSRIFYTPMNDQTKDVIENLRWILEDDGFQDGGDEDCSRMNQSFSWRRFTFEGFETAQLLEQSLVQTLLDSYPPNFYAGIIFIPNSNIDSLPKISTYELRFPDELRNIRSLNDVKNFIYSWALDRNFVDSANGYQNSSSGGVPDYFHEGFLTLQRALDYAILKTVDCSIPKVPFILKRFPYRSFFKRPFLQILPFVFPGLLMLSFSLNVQYVVRTICSDKESRINAYLLAMTGIQVWCLDIAHLLVILVKNVLLVVLLTVSLRYGLLEIDVLTIGLYLLLYAFNAVFFAFAMSSFFSSANLASAAVGILWIALYVPAIYLHTTIESMNRREIIMFAWLPGGSAVLFGVFVQRFKAESCTIVDVYISLLSSTLFFILLKILNSILAHSFACRSFCCESLSFPTRVILDQKDELFVRSGRKHSIPATAVGCINVVKDFDQLWGRKRRALNDISFDAYTNEITILLGKNGAGKSTLIRILTGHERNFSGRISIANHNVISDMSDIRRIMAYDPQYIFFIDGLTVQEHLEFFSNLKAGIFDKKKSKMLLSSLRLSNKRFEFAKNLSGGQLRRLCLAMSLINDYQIAFLDEPTSGIDPSGKCELLEVIQNERNNGKSILLVTHCVDEAETLGDRIIILNDGRVACAGAKMEVKNQFGNGYKLSIDFRNSKSLNSSKNVSHFVEILKRELLEIVASFYSTTTFSCKPLYYRDRVKVEFLLKENIFDDFEIFMRLMYNLENARTSFVVESIALKMPTMQDVFFNMCSAYNNDNTNESSETPIYLKSDEMNENVALFFQQMKAVSMKNFIYLYKDQLSIFIGQYFVLIVTLIGYCLLNDYLMRRDAQYSARKLDLSSFRRSHFYIFIDDYIENGQILGNLIKVAVEYNLSYTFVNFTDDRTDLFLLNESIRSSDFYYRNYFAVKLSNQISESDNYTVVLTGYFNNRALHVTPALINLFSNLISHNFYEIQTINRPLPQTTVLIYSFGQDFILALCLLVVLSVFIITPVKRIVDEKRNGQKFLQLISGLKLKAYWSSNYSCDLLIYILATILIVAIWSTMRVDLLCENGAWIHIIFILVLFYLAVLSWIYAISFLFDSSSSAITASLTISLLMGLAPLLIVTTLNYMSNDNDWMNIFQRRLANVCSALFPQFALCQALSVYYRNKLLIKQCSAMKNCIFLENNVDENFRITYNALEWKSPGIGYFLACFLWQTVFHWVVVYLVENHRALRQFLSDFVTFCSLARQISKEKVADDFRDARCMLELRDVTVWYSNRRNAAVQNLHFKVERGEIFGLNGPNGSGKTTTYKLLTGEVCVSCGSVFVGADLIENPEPSKMSKFVGFCPQFDALIEYLTVRQCLEYFAALRGILSGDIEEVVESLLQSTELASHDNLVKNLSGGKKRLLSLCVGLLGAPSLILLDEPTCGVDPTARRKVWKILHTMKKLGCCIILTSHDMEECETVCDKMLILSNGRSIGCQPMHSWVENYAVSQNVDIVLKPEVDINTFTASFEMLIPNSKLKVTFYFRSPDFMPRYSVLAT